MRVEFIKPVELTIKNKNKPTNEDKETDLNPASLEVTSKRPTAEPSPSDSLCIYRACPGTPGDRSERGEGGVGWGD